MKNNILRWLCFLVIACIVSCNKDRGNYDYRSINEVEITGIEGAYTALTGQPLYIQPELIFTEDKDFKEENYTFKWSVWRDNKLETLSEEKNLATDIPLLPGSYRFFFEVRDNRTGVISRREFAVHITSEIATGWLVLNDIDSESRLDMLNFSSDEEGFTYYKDILKSTNSVELYGKPKVVTYLQKLDPFNSATIQGIYVGTDQMTTVINNNNNSWTNYRDLKMEVFRNIPADFHAERIFPMGMRPGTSSSRDQVYVLGSDGVLSLENVRQSMVHGAAVNRLTAGVIPISRFAATMKGEISPYIVMYDTQNKRFLVHKGLDVTAFVPTAEPQMFNPGNVGMDLLFMDFTTALSGQFYALLKNEEGKVFLTRFVANNTVFNPLTFEEISASVPLMDAEFYALDPSQGYIMYNVGSKVYQYDPFTKSNKEMLDFGSRKISLLKYQEMVRSASNSRYMEYATKLIVCTYDEGEPTESGTMELYTVPSLNGALTSYQKFNGFGKIVDVTYRE